ncbi:MAG: endonuclease/exonuclease/phosphatase family protein [Alistipes sp.]|nr:endonuclease/exonuclease/phosphatase family protein [Alistipes sp.]
MKRLFIILCVVVACASCGTAAAPDDLTVMTLNMRYDNSEDGADNWQFRRDRIGRLIRSEQVDLLGTQELLCNQFDDLQSRLSDYTAVGVGREDGARAGEFNAVFFRTDRFALLDSGTFWLSETPEIAGSKGWDGACERLATWVVLRDKGDREFLFINTHLDHVGETARREGVALLLQRIAVLSGGRPVLLTGDFNAEPQSTVIAHVLRDNTLHSAWHSAAERHGSEWSFSDFGALPEAERPLIDFIFYGEGLTCDYCRILPDVYDDGYLSDHAPVEASFRFTE